MSATKSAPKAPPANDDHAWEKEFAPKVRKGRVIFVCTIYAAFTLLMAGLAIQRWTSLQ